MTRRILLAAVALAVVAAVPVLPAWAQAGELRVSQTTIAPGETVTVSGQCPAESANEFVPISLGGTPSGGQVTEIQADARGAFEGAATLPADANPGPASLVASCTGTTTDLTAEITVAAGSPTTTTPPTAVTTTTALIVPVGGVETGAGGTAGGPGLPWGLVAAGAAASVVAVLGLAPAFRRV